MSQDSRAFAHLLGAHTRFLSVGERDSADLVAKLYRKLSGGCEPDSHTWPVSGAWCYCGRTKWRSV